LVVSSRDGEIEFSHGDNFRYENARFVVVVVVVVVVVRWTELDSSRASVSATGEPKE